MPFKWRLKKTRKYDISTKNSFIVGVYLLDNAYLECTLSAESTGQECLKSIAQRIELSESQYFGLRYVTKKLHFHWVDLEKPLKKQLDKYAQPANHCHCLYFGVMFYVMGAHKIPDEVARYHYYLQLKNDVIDGRLLCSSDQAIRLAAYSLQAEFGDYEQDKYAVQNLLLYPKTMLKDETVAAELFSEAIAGHASLQGVAPIQAELQYVKEIQMMDGYSVEYYSAKDESRKDLYLGTSCTGIFARYMDGQSPVYYKWSEIAKVTQSKKSLEIDTSKSSVQFQLEDTDTAKYVCHLAQLQRHFYKSAKGNLSQSLSDVTQVGETADSHHLIDAQQVYIPPTDSTHSSQELGHSQTSLTHVSEQRYSQDVLQSSQQSLESSLEAQQQQLHHYQQHHMTGIDGDVVIGNGFYHQHVMRHESLTPTPEGDPVYVNRAALLPAYRPSPDYDAVMQQRILQQQHQQQQQQLHHQQQQQHPHFKDFTPHLGAAQVYVHPDGMAYSQPEISQNIALYRDEHGNYANVDALRNYSHSIYANIFQDNHGIYAGRVGDRGNNLAVHPTYSSPELNTELHQQEVFANNEFSAQEALAFHFRPPPPYPRTSSSTPDLAVQSSSNMMAEQPAPVMHGSKEVGPHDLLVQSRLDRSVDDLSGFKLAGGYSVSGHQYPFPVSDDSSKTLGGAPEIKKVPVREMVAGNMEVRSTEGPSVSTEALKMSKPSDSNTRVASEGAGKFLIDDQDDTSSEHSYSTFHAKESDESSEDENSRVKIVHPREEPNIHIRMFTPQEAPPPSKIKEEASLRESFRRLKIARTSSLNKDGPVFGRSSLRALKDIPDVSTLVPSQLNVVKEQLQEQDNKSAQTLIPSKPPIPKDISSPPEMKELLDRLGAPPPYPGKTETQITHSDADQTPMATNSNNNCVVEDGTKSIVNKSLIKPALIPKSSLGNIPLKSSAGKDCFMSKPRSSSFNLDTVVPVLKPGSAGGSLRNSDLSTSVLKAESAEAESSVANTDVDAFGLTSDKDGGVNSEKLNGGDDKDEASGRLEYSVGSDSDSDHERSACESRHMGPLKMAAMNGLTLSRSMVLSMMNDDTRAPTDDRRKMLESKISEGQVYVEFEQIPRKSEVLECSVSSAAHNASRNRFKDVLPYDATRVKLNPRKDNPDGYVNASHIKLTANDNKWLFIATQAPLENTAVDFWQMIWENSIDVLAMLTPFQESGKSKCFVYWPQEPGSQYKQIYGEYEVELQFTDDSLCYLTSRIILRHGGREHLVWHLQYTDWPDHGCPEDTYGFLGFLDEIESVARLAEIESGRSERPPVVVHCSAGVGRTGVVILTMVMKWCLEHNQNVDLPKALMAIRNQRMHMVQTMGQYKFIHDTLIHYLKNTRLI